MLHDGCSKPFWNICEGKKTAALVMACNGIPPEGWEPAAVPCMPSYAAESCAEGADLAQSLKEGGGGGGWVGLREGAGLEPPPPTHPLPPFVLSC